MSDFVRTLSGARTFQARMSFFHIDFFLLFCLLALVSFGLVILYSALDQNTDRFFSQVIRLVIAFSAMLVIAQFSPESYRPWITFFYIMGLILLLMVLFWGTTINGSKRWLNLFNLFRFQPSEIMKIFVPLMVSHYLAERSFPPKLWDVLVATCMIVFPAGLIVMQPDLGTSLLVAASGIFVIFFSGLSWRIIFSVLGLAGLSMPIFWMFLKPYQKQRIYTLLDPEKDPLGFGWNIIQSKIAIGSGGVWGKGLFQGTQSRLDFLPESDTDFIIAVIGEELGLRGVFFLLLVYSLIIARCLFIAWNCVDRFRYLVASSLTLTFFIYVFVNIAMVSGLLPVVGVPLPLVSYGGTSALTLLFSFGMLMAVSTHRRLA